MRTPVLVTGGAGYIGSHTAKALWAQGFLPLVADDLSVGHEWAVKWGPLFLGHLRDDRWIRLILNEHKPQAIIHFAASALVQCFTQTDLY